MLHTQSNINVAKVAATNTKDHYDEDKEEEGDKVECEGGATEEASNKASSNCAGVKVVALSNHDHPAPPMMILQLLLPFLSSLSLRRRLWFLVL